MISPREAWDRIEIEIDSLDTVRVSRRDSLGRVTSAPIQATGEIPAHDVSAMDGYAVSGPPKLDQSIPIAATIAAGEPPGVVIDPGTVVGIMTGAPVPEAADRVIPVEQTSRTGTEVMFASAGAPGDHIRKRGEIVNPGQEVLPAESLLTPGSLSLLATHGYREIPVHRRPSIATLATGDEVVSPESEPKPGQLRDSHTDFLFAAGASLGLKVDSLGIAADSPENIRERVVKGLGYDVFLVCGGVSMGEFDYVEQVLVESSCRVLFDAVAIQPGKPLVAARHSGGWVFGLPGNPASVMVGFWLFVRPLLRRLQGLEDSFWHGALEGVLTGALPGAKGRDRFLSADVGFREGRPLVRPSASKGSHDVSAFGHGTGLVRVPAHQEKLEAGAICEVLPLVDWPTPID